ncbi:MAG: hypothetical protein HYU66_27405 [Armatimonadetes bacterium]|nr:hypothetical protein [Armatimonadota bacterium]
MSRKKKAGNRARPQPRKPKPFGGGPPPPVQPPPPAQPLLPAQPSLFDAASSTPNVGRDPRRDRERAWELAHEALACGDRAHARRLALQALDLDPACTDAAVLLAALESRTDEEHVERLQAVIRAAENDLGPAFFRQNRGYFWGLFETRPYMRARGALAQKLEAMGRIDECIAQLEAMLELNPNDNQGMREPLLGHYLAEDRLEDARRLLDTYAEDAWAVHAFGEVLALFLEGDEAGAVLALAEAREANPHVEALLLGRSRMPRELPDSYMLGEASEAVFVREYLGRAWDAHPAAKAWLAAHRPGPDKRGRPDPPAKPDRDPSTRVPLTWRPRYQAIVDLTDAFCDQHLTFEYRDMCRKLAARLCRPGSPVETGKPESWAAGVVAAIGSANFLNDPGFEPYMTQEQVARGMGVGPSTLAAKLKAIRQRVDIVPFDPAWCLPSLLEHNPLVWMAEVNGFIMDLRDAPREVQELAFEQGVIPYIPGDPPEDR